MKQNIEIEVPVGHKAVYDGETQKVDFVKISTEPKTWKEFCEKTRIGGDEVYIGTDSAILTPLKARWRKRRSKVDKNLCTSKEEAEAFLALMQLRQLRKAWVGDWEPDLAPKDNPNCAIDYGFNLATNQVQVYLTLDMLGSHVLLFPSNEMAKKFLECFGDLIEKAKTLL